MNKYAITSLICIVLLITGCNKKQAVETKTSENKSDDIIYVSDKDVSFGYYKSSIIKVNGNLNVWLHMPKADKESKKEIERMSEILAEISCNLRQIKLLKATDFNGKEISLASNEKWDTPSPASDFYQVILKVCEEAK